MSDVFQIWQPQLLQKLLVHDGSEKKSVALSEERRGADLKRRQDKDKRHELG